MPEQPWETYECTKERMIDAIASMMGSRDDTKVRSEARKVEIAFCSMIGTYKLGKPKPISVTFQKRDDKE